MIEVVVGAIILSKENKVLLVKSDKWNNKYVIPGGHVEFLEYLTDAIKREVFEETALMVEDVSLLCIKENIFINHQNQQKHYLLFDFLCHTSQTEVTLNNEAQSYIWVLPEDVFSYDLDPFTRSFFESWLYQEKQDKIEVHFNC